MCSGFSAVGSAHVWGARGRWFESSNPDQTKVQVADSQWLGLFCFPEQTNNIRILSKKGKKTASVKTQAKTYFRDSN